MASIVGVLEQLRPANVSRMHRWHADADSIKVPEGTWTGADWGNAMGGECGEAQNIVKKLRCHETHLGDSYNTPDIETLHAALAEELADVVCYADLLAHHYGIDLCAAVVAKFNHTSKAAGFPERLYKTPRLPYGLYSVEPLT